MRLVLAVLLILTSPLALAIEVQGEGASFEEAKQQAFKKAKSTRMGKTKPMRGTEAPRQAKGNESKVHITWPDSFCSEDLSTNNIQVTK